MIIGYELQVKKVGEAVSVSLNRLGLALTLPGGHSKRTTLLSHLPTRTLQTGLRRWRHTCSFYLDFHSISNHSSISTTARPRGILVSARELLFRCTHNYRSTYQWYRRQIGVKRKPRPKIAEGTQQGVCQRACVARWLASTFGIHGLGTHFRWQIPETAVRCDH